MDFAEKERRKPTVPVERPTFGVLARVALMRRVAGARLHDAHWCSRPNLGWVRWPHEDGRLVFCGMRRRMDWITGEIGVSATEVELDELTLVQSLAAASGEGFRIQLGLLLHGQDKWWSSGGSEKSLGERLDWLAQQMQLRLFSLLSASPPPPP